MNQNLILTRTLLLLIIGLIILISCKEDPKPKTLAIVATGEVSGITATSATISGDVVSDGNSRVTEKGIVFGLSADPKVSDSKSPSGNGTGPFTAVVSSLNSGTIYHFRAYAINSTGTSYGQDKTFTTVATLPTVTTTSVSDLTISAAKSGGTISSDGGSPVIARGVCWSINPAPTTADSKTSDASGTGTFTSNITVLKSNTKYYVRAYATNSSGTAYGPELNFSTPVSPVPTTGLIAWWPFNGNAKDESGNGNDGTVNAALLDTDRKGTANSCYKLDGDGDYIFINKNLFDNGWPELTINIWYYLDQQSNPANVNSSHVLFNTSPHFALGLGMNWLSSNKYSIFLGTGTPSTTWNIFHNALSDQTLTIKQWRMYSVVKSGKSYRLYIDGVLDTTWTASTEVVSYLYKVYLGAGDPSITNEVIMGKIDDVSIHNRALTTEELLKIFNSNGF